MVLVALLAATAPGCLAGEAAAPSRLLPARPQRSPPGQGSARHPRREFGRVGPCPPPRNPTRATLVYRTRRGLMRDRDLAFARAYCSWPGRPPVWLIEDALTRAWMGGVERG